jgi:membrane protease YdiL (CAAX protease family)
MTPVDGLLIAALLVPCAFGWWRVTTEFRSGRDPIAYEPRLPVPWSGAMVVVVAAIYFLARFAMLDLFLVRFKSTQGELAKGSDADQIEAMLQLPGYAAALFKSVCLSDLMSLGVAVPVVLFATQSRAADIGFAVRRISRDIGFGVAGFFVVCVPALVLQAILQHFIAKSQHPIGFVLKNTTDPTTIFWAAAAAVVAAPLVEEFVFRGVLQGWLERVFDDTAGGTTLPASETATTSGLVAPVALPQPSPGPIVLSSIIFTLIHWQSGIDVVALFFVALGLGYLYRQTHRLWPGIVMHFLLNGFSTAALLLGADQ